MKILGLLASVLLSSSAFAASCGKLTEGPIRQVCLTNFDPTGHQSQVDLKSATGTTVTLKEVQYVKTLGGGEQAGGDMVYISEMRQVAANGQLVGPRVRVSIHKSWLYSEGYVEVSGKIPKGPSFSAIVESIGEQ